MDDPDLNNVPLELLSEVVIPDDEYEINLSGQENDTFAEAADLGRLTAPLVLTDLRGFDDDWYSFTTARTSRGDNFVRIDFDSTQDDLAIELLGADGSYLDGSNESRESEQISLEKLPPGTYYVRVYGGWNSNYALTIAAPNDADDRLEISPDATHNDSFAHAFALGPIDGPRVEDGLNLYDDDWYSFTTLRTGRSDNFVRIDFDRSQGDLAMELIAGDQAYLDGSNESLDSEQISLSKLPPGTYYIRVYGISWETNPQYRLTINAPTSADDAFEQNDTKETAAALGTVAGRKSWEKLMLFDDDYFSFTTLQTSRPDNFVRIDYNPALGNIDLWLIHADGSLIDLSEAPTERDEINLDRLPAGTYYIRAYGRSLETNPDYTLTISAPTGNDDLFEENDAPASAFSLGLLTGSSSLNSAALFDDDFYSFTTARTGGPDDNVRIDYSLASGNIDLDLLDAEGNLLDFSQESADSDSVSLEGRPAGTYYLRVYGLNNQTNPNYSLTITAPSLAEDVTLQGSEGADTFVLRQTVAGDAIQVFKVWPISGLPAVQIARSQVGGIVIDALGGDDRLFIDLSNGDPLPLMGLSFNGEEGADTITISGTTADDWVEVDAAGLNISNSHVAYTGTESLRLSDPTGTARLDVLVLAPGTRLDLTNNSLVLSSADVAGTMALIRSGRNGGTWDGPGLITSSANADQGLAVDVIGDGVKIRFTWNGDVNLDGRVNADDYFYIDQGFLQKPNPPVYHNGDFNFDGKINADDYFMIDQAFLNQKGVVLSAQRPQAALSTTARSRPPVKVFSTTRLKKPIRRRPIR